MGLVDYVDTIAKQQPAGGVGAKPAAPGQAPATPARNVSLQIQDLQEELVQRVPAFKYTPGKFDDATNKALIYFVRDTTANNKADPVWQAMRRGYESQENPIVSANPQETLQNLGQIIAIFRSQGEPQTKEVSQKVYAEIPIQFRDLPTVNFPLLYAAQNKEQLDQVVKQFLVDPWLEAHGQPTDKYDPAQMKSIMEEVMRLVLAEVEKRPEFQAQQQQFVGLHLVLAKRFNEVIGFYQSKLEAKQTGAAQNIYDRLKKDFFVYYGNPKIQSSSSLQQATEEIVYFLQRQKTVDENGQIISPQRYEGAKIPIEGILRRYFGNPQEWKMPAQSPAQPAPKPVGSPPPPPR